MDARLLQFHGQLVYGGPGPIYFLTLTRVALLLLLIFLEIPFHKLRIFGILVMEPRLQALTHNILTTTWVVIM